MDNVQLNNIVSQGLNIMMQFTMSFVPCFIGVYAKEFYDVAQKKKRKISIKNAVVAALTLACVAIGFIQMVLDKFGIQLTFTLLFLIGAFSNKIIDMVFDGSLLKIVLRFLGKSKENLQDSIEETLKENNKKKKE